MFSESSISVSSTRIWPVLSISLFSIQKFMLPWKNLKTPYEFDLLCEKYKLPLNLVSGNKTLWPAPPPPPPQKKQKTKPHGTLLPLKVKVRDRLGQELEFPGGFFPRNVKFTLLLNFIIKSPVTFFLKKKSIMGDFLFANFQVF